MAQAGAITTTINADNHFRKNATVHLDVRVRGLRMLRLRWWLARWIMSVGLAALGCDGDVNVIYENERS